MLFVISYIFVTMLNTKKKKTCKKQIEIILFEFRKKSFYFIII